jgi:glycosyltransferase involved in cell wall biosynthesis
MHAPGSAPVVRRKLLVVTTHPIQYIAPWFRELAQRPEIELHVVFFRHLNAEAQAVGFGNRFQWDVPLLEGYSSINLDVKPGGRHVASLLWKLRKVVAAYQPHVALVTGWNEPGLVATYPLLRMLGVSVICRGEANAIRRRGRSARIAHRTLFRLFNAVVAIGKSNRQHYLDSGVSTSKIFSGAYFVENERMLDMCRTHRNERDALRAAYGFAPDEPVALFCGKHVPFKRPELLLNAASTLRTRGRPIGVLYAGSGELTETLRATTDQLGVKTAFTGFLNQTELWKAYVAADFFVLPSTDQETWGLVVNEAMLFTLPVVVSERVGSAQDLVVEGETGFTFAEEASELADAISRLLDVKSKWAEIGQRAQNHVVSNYSASVATRGLLDAVEFVCP